MKGPTQTQCDSASNSLQKLLILAVVISMSSNTAALAFPWKSSKPQGQSVSPGASKANRADDLKTQPAKTPVASGSEQILVTSNEITIPVLQSLARHPSVLPNLRMVSGRLLRGGQPSEAGLN